MAFMDYTVIGSERLKNIVKVSYVGGPGGPGIERFTDVRGGLAWSSSTSPMFAVVVGELAPDANLAHNEPIYELLHEKELGGIDLEQKFNAVGDISCLFANCEWWCAFLEKYDAQKESWWDYQGRKPQQGGDIQPAPYENDYRTGLEICKSLLNRNKLLLPKTSVVHAQLANFAEADLALPDVAQKYFAINALRFCITAFRRYAPIRADNISMHTQNGEAQGWML